MSKSTRSSNTTWGSRHNFESLRGREGPMGYHARQCETIETVRGSGKEGKYYTGNDQEDYSQQSTGCGIILGCRRPINRWSGRNWTTMYRLGVHTGGKTLAHWSGYKLWQL